MKTRKNLKTWLTMSLFLSGIWCTSFTAVFAEEVSWLHGETPPANRWQISPTNPTSADLIHFSGPIKNGEIYDNSCLAEQAMGGTPTLTINAVSKNIELRFESPAPESCTTEYDPVCGLEDSTGPLEPGEWTFWAYSPGLLHYFSFQVGSVYYVDADASLGGSGTSWADAFKYLQDALDTAKSADQIRVAQGMYVPDQNSSYPDGTSAREATFQLINGVTIEGGYAGFGEPDPNARDVETYKTILSGDLNANDVGDFDDPSRNENSYHVVTASGTNNTAILDGFTITAGNADGFDPSNNGGGMYNNSGRPTISNCTFSMNFAEQNGGGIYCDNYSVPKLTNCIINDNGAGNDGGGVYNYDHSDVTLTNCTVSGNTAGNDGGGIYNELFSDTILTNATTSNNTAGNNGGGIWNRGDLMLTNSMVSGNSAGEHGGAVYNWECTSTLTNCTFTRNSASIGNALAYDSVMGNHQVTNCILWDGGNEVWKNTSLTITITYSDVQGGWEGNGNIDADPCFVDPDNEDYHLHPNSPCIDAGNNEAVPGWLAYDFDGYPRIIGTVDMGAYEYHDYDCNGNGVNDIQDILDGTSLDCNGNWIPDECDIANGTSTDYNGNGIPDECEPDCNGNGVPDDWDIATGTSTDYNSNGIPDECEPDCNGNGVPDDWDIATGTSTDENGNGVPDECETIYVDANASLDGNGASWATAYNDLQDALDVADGPEGITTICVGAGTYTPDRGSGDRTATFQLIDGVTIKGGYAGLGGPDPNVRDVNAYETILSGDLNYDDEPNFTNNGDNSYHVVTGSWTDETAVLDGFTITAGNADGSDPDDKGGGMLNYHSDATLTNCTFSNNKADDDGGGICNGRSDLTLTNCVFNKNSAGYGAGMCNKEFSYPILTKCSFTNNSAGYGAGMCNNYKSAPILTNCSLSNNSAEYDGGAIYTYDRSNLTLTNCTFTANSASNGNALAWDSNRQLKVTNCILWDGGSEIWNNNGDATITITYSNVQGGWPGDGNNIDIDPNFVDPNGPDDDSDTWEDNDYHLQWNSPCINAGDPCYVVGQNEHDIDGEPRVMLNRVDMGADEVGEKQADFTRDGIINFKDFVVLGQSWMSSVGEGNWYVLCDLYKDRHVNLADLADFANDWLWQANWYGN